MEKKTGPKIGADGLTKKQRRALKVQENGKAPPASESPPAPAKAKDTSIAEDNRKAVSPPAPTKVKNKKDTPAAEENGKSATTPASAPAVPAPAVKTKQDTVPAKNQAGDSNAALTEKQLRKLEWEKKLAEQNKTEPNSKSDVSKAELKAQRREQQEAQRLAKVKAEQTKPAAAPEATIQPSIQPQSKKPNPKTKIIKKVPKKQLPKNSIDLVSHLYLDNFCVKHPNQCVFPKVHKSFVRLAAQYGSSAIMGSKATSIAFLGALRDVVIDIDTPPGGHFIRNFYSVMTPCLDHLNENRPISVAMTNAWRSFKAKLEDANDMPNDADRKQYLLGYIKTYVSDEVRKAGEAISLRVYEKIVDDDVILTYSHSSVVCEALVDAHKAGKRFKVIIIDGRPFNEGTTMLFKLLHAGIDCTYFYIDCLHHAMRNVSKVLLGAHAFTNNGCVISRIGTAQVAAVARQFNRPVMFCSETYKFTERIHLDSFEFNVLGPEEDIINIRNRSKPSPVENLYNKNKCSILNMMYDVAPQDLVKGIATEISVMPPHSAAVVLKFKPELYMG